MSTRKGRLHEGRDNLRRTQEVVNELFDRQPAPGVAYFPAAEDVPAFYCVGADIETDGVVIAKADPGSIQAVGIAVQAAPTSTTAKVRFLGRIDGAVSGRAPNDPVYVGDDGSLIFAPTGSAYNQQVAVCINATDIFVVIGAPVF